MGRRGFMPKGKNFEKRKATLMKKAQQLSVLCGIDVCIAVDDNSEGSSGGTRPTVWPQDPSQAKRVVERYFAGPRNMVRKKTSVSDSLIDGLTSDERLALLRVLRMNIDAAKKKIAALEETETAAVEDAPGMDWTTMLTEKFELPLDFQQPGICYCLPPLHPVDYSRGCYDHVYWSELPSIHIIPHD